MRKHVENVVIENNEAKGVIVRDNKNNKFKVIASTAVVSNIDIFNTRRLINIGESETFDEYLDPYIKKTPILSSFIHLHAGYKIFLKY